MLRGLGCCEEREGNVTARDMPHFRLRALGVTSWESLNELGMEGLLSLDSWKPPQLEVAGV